MRTFRIILMLAVSASLPLAGCRKESPRRPAPPPRVVTFSPALTDMTFAMGLGDHVVGVTTRCTLPPGQQRPRVGDRFSVSAESILTVEPDVLLVQQNAADFAAVQRLRPGVKVEHFDIERLADIPAAMRRIGVLCGDAAAGERAAGEFQSQLDAVANRVKGLPRPRVLFVLGYEKPGTGGRSSFIHDMIEAAGGVDAGEKYPRWADLGMESILALSPDVLICWVDPGQEQQALARWQSFKALPAVAGGKVFVVSDPNWTIPTGRTAELTGKLAEMIHGLKGAMLLVPFLYARSMSEWSAGRHASADGSMAPDCGMGILPMCVATVPLSSLLFPRPEGAQDGSRGRSVFASPRIETPRLPPESKSVRANCTSSTAEWRDWPECKTSVCRCLEEAPSIGSDGSENVFSSARRYCRLPGVPDGLPPRLPSCAPLGRRNSNNNAPEFLSPYFMVEAPCSDAGKMPATLAAEAAASHPDTGKMSVGLMGETPMPRPEVR